MDAKAKIEELLNSSTVSSEDSCCPSRVFTPTSTPQKQERSNDSVATNSEAYLDLTTPSLETGEVIDLTVNESDASNKTESEVGISTDEEDPDPIYSNPKRVKKEQYYSDDPELPVYSQVTTPYKCHQFIDILMSENTDKKQVCRCQPLAVDTNVSFIIDLDCVCFADLKADDMGSWKSTGTKHTYFHFDKDGEILYSQKASCGKKGYYDLIRRYYVHGTCSKFHRLIISIEDHVGQLNMLAMIQYYFKGPVIPVFVKPHGNSKSNKPFFRTSETAQKEGRLLAEKHTPSKAVAIMTSQLGGEVNIKGAGSVVRDQMQVKNFRRKSTTKEDNALHAILLECKLAQGKSDAFIRDVKAAPEPMAVCYADWQINDLERFCTNPDEFSILTVDTTFNLGDFYVTPTCYKHLLLEDIRSGDSPLIPGPILVHQQMKFASFNYFASTLIDGNKKLRHIQAFGTDGDANLSEAFSHNFPYAHSLRCFIHFERNLQEKLRGLGIPAKVANEFVCDVMGNRQGSTYEAGLVDCMTISDFDQTFARLEKIWNLREKPFSSVSGPRFYQYFKQYKADAVRFNMLRGIREAAGLGSPPSIFTTNMSESLNKIIKQHVQFKASQWPEFNRSLQSLVEAKREEIIRALSGRGLYRLRAQYAHLCIDQIEWQRKRPDQRKKLIKQLDDSALVNANPHPAKRISVNEATITPPSVNLDIEESQEKNIDDSASTSHSGSTHQLGTSPVESGITNLHQSVLLPMWEKANKLLQLEHGAQRAPSSDPSAWCVQSFSSPVPHFVTSKSSGQFLCDSQCPQWVSTKICSHTLVASEKSGKLALFLKWYVSTNQETNITETAMLNMPSGRGRKGGVPKRKRSKCPAEPDVTVSRSSLSCSRSSSSICSSITEVESPPTYGYGDRWHYPYWYSPAQPSYPMSSSSGSYWSTPPSLPANPNPFYIKFISGNIRVCQGCKGSLRTAGNSIPMAPHNLCIARAEKRPYRDASGNLITPTTYKACHYHLSGTCVQAAEPMFIPSTLQIPTDIRDELSQGHKDYIMIQLGICI